MKPNESLSEQVCFKFPLKVVERCCGEVRLGAYSIGQEQLWRKHGLRNELF